MERAPDHDWELEILQLLHNGEADAAAYPVPWPALVRRYRESTSQEQQAMGQQLLAMLDLDYRNPHSEPADPDAGGLPLPAAMQPDDLLCLEAAVYAAAELGLPGARERLQAIIRAPRFHAVLSGLRHLHMDLNELMRGLK